MAPEFTIAISNPPYQEAVGPKKTNVIYDKFTEGAGEIAERYSVIVQGNWLVSSTAQLSKLRENILTEATAVTSYENSDFLFPGTSIPGGVTIITSKAKTPQTHSLVDGYYLRSPLDVSLVEKVGKRGAFSFYPEAKYMLVVGESNGAALAARRIIGTPRIVESLEDSPYKNPQILYSSDDLARVQAAVGFWRSKVVRYLISLLKSGHHQPIRVFRFIPDVDPVEYNSDESLVKALELSDEEWERVNNSIAALPA